MNKKRKDFIFILLMIIAVVGLCFIIYSIGKPQFTGKAIEDGYYWKNLGKDGFSENSCKWETNGFQCNSENIGKVGWSDRNLDIENGYWFGNYWMSNVKCIPWDDEGYYVFDNLFPIYKYQCVPFTNTPVEDSSNADNEGLDELEPNQTSSAKVAVGDLDKPVLIYSSNLLMNGDFELGNVGERTIPLYWNKNSANDAGVIYNTEYTSWNKGATIFLKDKSSSWIGIRSNTISLEKNRTYVLSGLTYCSECGDKNNLILTLHVGRYGYPGTTHYSLINGGVYEKHSRGYDKTEINFLTNNEDNLFAYVIIAFKPGNTGKAYADNIELKKLLIENEKTSENDNLDETLEEEIEDVNVNTPENLNNIQKISFESVIPQMTYKTTGENNLNYNDFPSYTNPVILYKDVNVIRDRIKREPYFSWFNEIKTSVEWVMSPSFEISSLSKIEKARYAKLTSFIYAVTKERRYADKAKELLLSEEGTYNKDHHEDVDGLIMFSEAYDILAGENYDFGNSVDCRFKHNCHRVWTLKKMGSVVCDVSDDCNLLIRSNIHGQMSSLAKNDIGDILNKPDVMLARNNLHIRRYSAVGIASLALQKSDYFDIAIKKGIIVSLFGQESDFYKNDGLSDVIMKQVVHNQQGAWAEGPYYMRYAFNSAIPFIKAMNNAGTNYNWLSSNNLRNLFDWGVKIRMPNGARPPFDDSNMDSSYFFGGYLDDPVHHWDWINSDSEYYSNYPPVTYLVDAICYYDDTIPIEEPQWNPTLMLPGAGQIIFRSGWEKDDIYLAFLGENGKAIDEKLAGNTHEHDDSMSFILYAYGEYLAIDSGYINYNNRDKVSKAKNHNVVLVNNQVSTESFANQEKFFTSDFLDYGEITDKIVHNRGILFVDKEYFLVFDNLDNYKSQPYSLIIHGNGLDSSGTFREIKNGFEWKQDKANLFVYTLKGAGINVNTENYIHCNSYEEITDKQYHTAISVDKLGKKEEFLTLLYPSKTGNYPIMSEKIVDGIVVMKMQKDNSVSFAFSNKDLKLVEISDLKIKTDALRFFAKTTDNNLDYVFIDNAKTFSLDENVLFNSNNPITAILKFEDDSIKLYHNSKENIFN